MASVYLRFISILVTVLATQLPEQFFFMVFWAILFSHNSLSLYKNFKRENILALALTLIASCAIVYFYSIKAILVLFCLHHGYNEAINIQFKKEKKLSIFLRLVLNLGIFAFLCSHYSSLQFFNSWPKPILVVGCMFLVIVANLNEIKDKFYIILFELLGVATYFVLDEKVQYFEYIVFYHLVLWILLMNSNDSIKRLKMNIAFVMLALFYVGIVMILYWPYFGYHDNKMNSLKVFNSVYGIYHIVFTLWLSKNFLRKSRA